MNNPDTLDADALAAIERKYDTSLNTRDNGPTLKRFIYWASIAFALYHLWTAGFGTPVDYVHMGSPFSWIVFIYLCGFSTNKE